MGVHKDHQDVSGVLLDVCDTDRVKVDDGVDTDYLETDTGVGGCMTSDGLVGEVSWNPPGCPCPNTVSSHY